MEINEIEKLESPKASKLMMRMVLIAALIIIVIGIIYYRSLAALPFSLGVIATSGLNIIKLRMLERTVQKIVYMEDQEMGKNIIRLQYLLRYLITGVVLVIIGLISTYTTEPAFYSSREAYFAVWAAIFPNAPEALKNAPLISIWGAIAGIFTMQLSVILVRSMKLEKDGTNFIEYKDEDETDENTDEDTDDVNVDIDDEIDNYVDDTDDGSDNDVNDTDDGSDNKPDDVNKV